MWVSQQKIWWQLYKLDSWHNLWALHLTDVSITHFAKRDYKTQHQGKAKQTAVSWKYKPRKSKVANFDNILVANKAVSCGEVTVDEALALEVCHCWAYLVTHLDQHVGVGKQALLVPTQILQQRACITHTHTHTTLSTHNLFITALTWKTLNCERYTQNCGHPINFHFTKEISFYIGHCSVN